ncbi:MAG: response regulator [Archangiaceae bacterium]|nr:response regulator [Archangiaceae bacterium]
MAPPEDSPPAQAGRTRTGSLVLGLLVTLVTSSVLTAWLVGGDFAHTVADRMKSNTSLGLTLCGIALALRATARAPRAADALASGSALIGALTLVEYLLRVDLGFDQMLQREHSGLAEAVVHPNRMAPNAAFGLLVAGLGLLAVPRGRALVALSQLCAVLLFMVGFIASIGYLYGAEALYRPTSFIRISGLSSLSMTLLGAGLMLLRTDVGLSRLLFGHDAGGWVLRRALPAVLGLPMLMGWLRLSLEEQGRVDTATGTAVLVVMLTAVSAVLTVMLASSVAGADRRRQVAQSRLEAQARLTAALARAATVDEVARVVVHEGAAALGATAASLTLPDEKHEFLEYRGVSGYPAEVSDQYARLPIAAQLPPTQAWRENKPVLLQNRADFAREFPAVPTAHLKYEAWAALPLAGRDRVLGVLGLSFSTAQRFAGPALEHLSVFAWHCAQAVERALLLDSERGLRAAAERTMTELRAAQQDAVAANQTKDEFLAMLGHELRNPLAPIAIALDMLDRRKETALLRERRIISRQVKHLMRMVDDLLDVSRIARGKIQLARTRVELKSVVTRAIELAAPLLEQKRHHLDVDVPETGLPLLGDEHRLTQVVSNLLTNAARYTEDEGHIKVRAVRRDGRVVLTVEDDGDGIDAAQLPRLFTAFVQAPTQQRSSAGGLGLGLALVKKFTELHGGSVSVESAGLRQGSTFTVELPLASEEQEPVTPARRDVPTERAAARRVLVVDDNVDAAEMLAEGLRAEGHDVRVANDGPRGIDVATAHKPDVAFLDLGMPAMSGYEVAARLRELDPGLVLVAVTGYGQPSDRARTRAAGFQHHLVKPVDLEQTLIIAREAPVHQAPASA